MIFKSLTNNLSTQLLKKVFLFYIMIAITLTAIQMIVLFQNSQDNVKNTLKNFKVTFAPSLKRAIWDMQNNQIKELINGVVNFQSVIAIQVVDLNGKITHEAGVSLNKDKLHENIFFEEFNMIYNDIFIGKVVVYSSTYIVFKKVKNAFIVLLINAILKTTALWFLMLWISKEMIGRPLKILTEELEYLDLDNLHHHKLFLNLSQKNELSIVENTFNRMIVKLQNTFYKLDMLNKTLEHKVKDRTKALEISNKNLEKMANTDPMTHAYNRRYFFTISKKLVPIINRERGSVSVIMIDIDKFKNINDTYGHDVGDKVIIKLVDIISNIIRTSDVLARFGGEEFAVMFPNTSIEDAKMVAEKIRKETEQTNILNNITFTVSIGVAKIINDEPKIEPALNRADNALFIAKDTGRNKTVVDKRR